MSLYRFSINLLSPSAFRQIHFSLSQNVVSEIFIYFRFVVFAWLDRLRGASCLGCSGSAGRRLIPLHAKQTNANTNIEIVWRCYSFLSIRCHIFNYFVFIYSVVDIYMFLGV